MSKRKKTAEKPASAEELKWERTAAILRGIDTINRLQPQWPIDARRIVSRTAPAQDTQPRPYLDLVIDGETLVRHENKITLMGNELRFVVMFHRAGFTGLSHREAFDQLFGVGTNPNAFYVLKGSVKKKLSRLNLHMINLSRGMWALTEKPIEKPK